MNVASGTHLVLIPSYNTGRLLLATVCEARKFWAPVWVVIDGSTDESTAALQMLAPELPGTRVLVLSHNQGKGAAILHGLREACAAGFTHVLAMDADGQHPADRIPEFMAASSENPSAMILGCPIFDSSAPAERIYGRKIANFWANLETQWAGIEDALFGFRVYPAEALRDIMEKQRGMRRFDFDAEAAIRLAWLGIRPVNIAVPVKYLGADQGGISHFHYLRDNLLLIRMFTRLFFGFVQRLWHYHRGTVSTSNHSAID